MPGTNAPRLAEPQPGCSLCPRLVEYRAENAKQNPTWFNGAVPSFGALDPQLLIVGLAPGVTGANRTGRPFTGDFAGDLLYATLTKFGFANGAYDARPDDGLTLHNCMITNAVRCVPPQNKPTSDEIKTCRPFLQARITSIPKLKAILALGRIAHEQVLSALEKKRSAHPFGHGAHHALDEPFALFDSYHCSRYNTNTGRLTTAMFENVFAAISEHLTGK